MSPACSCDGLGEPSSRGLARLAASPAHQAIARTVRLQRRALISNAELRPKKHTGTNWYISFEMSNGTAIRHGSKRTHKQTQFSSTAKYTISNLYGAALEETRTENNSCSPRR